MNAPAKRTGAAFHRGSSKQDVETPEELIDAVERRFGPISFDLAANAANAKYERFFTEADDALSQPWDDLADGGLLWLNPPYAHITPWARKCVASAELGARIAMLVPASVGSRWYLDHVRRRAMALALTPRVRFVGHPHVYPKDLILCMYGPRGEVPWCPGFDDWRWQR